MLPEEVSRIVNAGAAASKLSAALTGAAETLKNFVHLIEQAPIAADRAAEAVALDIYHRSQEYVPVRDPEVWGPRNTEGGSLKLSGQVFRSDRPGEWIVGYGGAGLGTPRDPYYAVYVHEIGYHSHQSPTQSKYLEKAVTDVFPDLAGRVEVVFRENFFGPHRSQLELAPLSVS